MVKYHPDTNNVALVEKAYHFAEKAHEGQKRKSGEPYFVHPLIVSGILAGLMLDAPTIAAGLLHDTVEDCDEVTLEVIEKEFGQEVALLVDGVTKLKRLNFTSRVEQQAESIRKMILAMSKDIRVVLIKLADRMHNMRTLKAQSPESQKRIAQETLDIYAPLAHRLGVYKIKQELEDLCLRYLDPEGYQNLSVKVGMKRAEREENIRAVMKTLSEKISEMNIRFEIDGRPKHFYSIYRKMVLQNKPFEQIFDLIALRVLVDSVQDCYAVLGVVHTLWKQVPNRFKDYISMPKPNMYQSLHTTVVGENGMPFEVQIRTHEMHRIAEYGIAAHWRYKEGKHAADGLDNKLYWLRQILDWQNDMRDSEEFIKSLKVDLFSDEIFVFTPKGEIVDLPRGATPIDFAYRIHSAVGNKCVGAKVNGRIVTLDAQLDTGDFVEIITQQNSKGPSRDWLKIVKTSQAKAKIRNFYKKELKEENIANGRQMLEYEAKRQSSNLPALMKPEYCEPILRKFSFADIDDLYAAVGCGGITAAQVVTRLKEEQKNHEKPLVPVLPRIAPEHTSSRGGSSSKDDMGIRVAGLPGCQVHFAKCCTPLPGDEIIGYITRGRGVTIHSRECVNVNDSHDPARWIQAEWSETTNSSYNGSIQILCADRSNLLADLMSYLSAQKVTVCALNARVNSNQTCTIELTLQVASKQELDWVIKQIAKRQDTIEIFRV
ncbi:MAG: bifunctional (p)ppGpp synthetase/guanosine-3',5'-bis(diphosphate) 3'-pyrophosphohydrolase [Clostridia bacterium]|nr:bifunctional (p)ppGpp synthetase/guanosine-3',5'-bis(diphosphate) 3'-pyrophosphohydrolase [Clostridia bacterium]MBQ6858810.1 bifunctional (p)ppGpp synthetase/guanosine-3',5'-bis(diphosphate) 3'-pyrophosphohydrolase [Clostridia bacterium]MBQ7052150.1 bifunctional (p)ppGpp synthetase/guanosine-3',5'-bis(diphosphate) 3'-pyrophosphohydrolase [Clostridia bacterium]